jgi:hypothetical protein
LAFFPEQFRSTAAIEDKFWGTEVSVPAPYGDGEVSPGAISIDAVASTAVSIDFTAISTNVAISYDKEGVVIPRG